MNIRNREDTRAFRDFYPDASLRHQVHYLFAHRFLPQYVWQNPYAFFSYLYRQDIAGGAMEPTRFIQSRWAMFEENAGLIQRESRPFNEGTVFRRVSDLSMSIHELGGRAGALVQMPTPEQAVEAFFVGVVLSAPAAQAAVWSRDVPARVFTLEAQFRDPGSEGTAGLICEWTREGEHHNFGVAIPAQRDAFLRSLLSVLESPNVQSRGGFSPSKDGTPGTINLRVEEDLPPRAKDESKRPWWKIG